MRTHNILISCVRDAKDNEHQCYLYKYMRCHCVRTRTKEEVRREQMAKNKCVRTCPISPYTTMSASVGQLPVRKGPSDPLASNVSSFPSTLGATVLSTVS
jgi:hypothetical protein